MSAQINPDRHRPTLTDEDRNRQTGRYVSAQTKPDRHRPTLTDKNRNR